MLDVTTSLGFYLIEVVRGGAGNGPSQFSLNPAIASGLLPCSILSMISQQKSPHARSTEAFRLKRLLQRFAYFFWGAAGWALAAGAAWA
jgi:hypothetical protein